MKQPVLLAVLALASLAPAQFGGGGGGGGFGVSSPSPSCQPTFGTSPAVPHPQNLDREPARPAPTPSPSPAAPACEAKQVDPETVGPQLAGRELKTVVKKVAALAWHERLTDAKARSAATGKPILWVQALGELDGLA